MAYKVVFVCLGNICRSPTAENIMDHLLQQQAPDLAVETDSAGTGAYHVGESPDRRMRQAAREYYGIELKGQARQFKVQDFQDFDLIVAMDRQNYQNILRLDPDQRYADKVKMMCSYCTQHSDQEVPDPYYGGESGFRYVIELLTDACSGLLDSIRQQQANATLHSS